MAVRSAKEKETCFQCGAEVPQDTRGVELKGKDDAIFFHPLCAFAFSNEAQKTVSDYASSYGSGDSDGASKAK